LIENSLKKGPRNALRLLREHDVTPRFSQHINNINKSEFITTGCHISFFKTSLNINRVKIHYLFKQLPSIIKQCRSGKYSMFKKYLALRPQHQQHNKIPNLKVVQHQLIKKIRNKGKTKHIHKNRV